MSTLTKVFVVLLVVVSIAFASVSVSIVAQTPNWKDTAEKYQEHARIADTNLRHEIAASAALLASARDEVRGHLGKITELETKVQEGRNEAGQLKSDLTRATAEKSSVEALSRGLLAQLQAADASRAEYQKQRNELERSNLDLSQRNVDMNDRVNELTARLDVQLEQKRHCEQQINILRSENERLAQSTRQATIGATLEEPEGAALSGVRAVTAVASRAIRGRVVELSGDLITLSVGGADGVKKDMVFVITRDGDYVGDVQVTLVKPDESAGRLITSARAPVTGDSVQDALGLGGSRG